MTTNSMKRIPYGIGDYRRIRELDCYYVDKTHFIPLIEASPLYLFSIRPRRFGKTLWLTLLQSYYDINLADEFEFLFGDTYIGQNPTAERNSYLVLFLNFALVNPKVEKVEESFEDNGTVAVGDFLVRYSQFFSDKEAEDILAAVTTEQKIRRISTYAAHKGLKFYLFIDEYDNFANTILTGHGRKAYEQLTREDGFFRYFFNLLKGATGGQIRGLSRMYISGVSPITMDDVTSGFNVGENISLDGEFNEMIGFTEAEVRPMLEHYAEAGHLQIPIDEALDVMRVWYNNYRFSADADSVLFNSTLIFYFLRKSRYSTKLPYEMIDPNLMTDYGKLRHLITIDRRISREESGDPTGERQEQNEAEATDSETGTSRALNGNFSILRSLIENGEAATNVAISFPLEGLLKRENFVSQLYYFGLLTFSDQHRESKSLLTIPNRTVRDLLYGYIRSGLEDADHFRIDLYTLSNLISDMAHHGKWQPFFTFLAEEIRKQTSVRDYLEGEKVIQGFLLAYLNVTHFYHVWSEKDMGNGFADFYMEPFLARYSDMKYGYLIELEYISRGEFSDKVLAAKIAEAKAQLRQYGSDSRIQEMSEKLPIKKLILVYSGWELVHQEEVD